VNGRELVEKGALGRTSSGTDDDELARAESDVERARERLASSMLALRHEVARKTDWRSWVRRQPAPFLGAAVALGFWLGYRR
jgi:hypothetical protein